MNIVLGTANFNLLYGYQKYKVKDKDIKRITKFIEGKIKFIDSSESYYKKNNFLINLDFKNFNLNSKISEIKGNSQIEYDNSIYSKVNLIINSYKLKKINILFLHKPEEILKKKGKYLINSLKKMKKKKLISHIGYSVYNPNDAKKLINKFKPDVIQIPFNVFDKRILENKFQSFLKKKNIKIQIRSIFLQGILTNKSILNNKKFLSFKSDLKSWYRWIETKGITPEEGAINFILNHKKYFDTVVVGIDTFLQLKNNINYFKNKNKVKFQFPNFKLTNKKIIDPRKW